MEVRRVPPPPPPPPPPTYDITGLTEDEITFLRDLCGRFSCEYKKDESHVHNRLFAKLDALTPARSSRTRFRYVGSGEWNVILRCEAK